MNPWFALSALFFGVGVIAGTALDERTVRAPARRGEYLVLEADFHVHTRFSDGFLSPYEVLVHAERKGLHALAVTEHNLVFPSEMARWFARRRGGPVVITGEEITSNRYHVHGLGLRDRVLPYRRVERVIDAVHAQGGLVIAAHPVRHFWDTLVPVRDRLDGTEVMHPIVYRGGRNGWDWEPMREYYSAALRTGHRLTAIGSSDYHFASVLGLCRTLVFAREATEAGVMEALRASRTVVVGPRGEHYGDPAMIALVETRPYTSAAPDYHYRARGPLDAATRRLGWAGALGLLALKPRKRR